MTLATLLCTSVVCEAAPANGDDWLRASVPETAQVVAGTVEGGVRRRILVLGNGLVSRQPHVAHSPYRQQAREHTPSPGLQRPPADPALRSVITMLAPAPSQKD